MPSPHSTDLRERVLAAAERGEASQGGVARRFGVSERTVSGWLKLARSEGRRGPKPHGGGRSRVGGTGGVLTELVRERNDATLAEYADLLAERTGTRRSASALCRALGALGLARKKSRSGRPSRIARTSPGRGRRGAWTSPGSSLAAWSSWTRPASTPG
jgi:transposase